MGDLDWEDWDPSEGNFYHHMLAGSIAGIAEHTVMYPVDTIKTHVQCWRDCPERAVGVRVLDLMRESGPLRLWRGVSTMLTGCVPAHALYFSALELLKSRLGVNQPGHHPLGAAVAGATATIFHDAVMTPMDLIKQRLQLGYYKGIVDCAQTVYRVEGFGAFYRSFPTTLFMNMPYGFVMVSMNETIKRLLRPKGDFETSTYVIAGCGAGAVAALATTPLDVVKTRLQTQALNTAFAASAAAAAAGGGGHAAASPPHGGSGSLKFHGLVSGASAQRWAAAAAASASHASAASSNIISGAVSSTAGGASSSPAGMAAALHSGAARCRAGGGCASAEAPAVVLQYQGLLDAVRQIRAKEGYRGFMRGALPRLLVHTPSVAISWTTYETIKKWLQDPSR